MQGFSQFRVRTALIAWMSVSATLFAQNQIHGRKYKPPPVTTHIVVTVEKAFNGKPMPNAAVVFYSTKDGKDNGNLELKTDPDGRATLDLIETGSHVRVQVIASGYATYSEEFDVPGDQKELLVKMQRPRAQVSTYEENDGKAATVKPGVQEHVVPKTAPASSTPKPSSSSTPQ